MTRLLILTTVVAFSFSQHYANSQVTGGSVAEFNLLRSMNKVKSDAAMNWNIAKKITLLKELPDGPKSQGQCLQFANLKNGDTGFFSYWSPKVISVIDEDEMLVGLSNASIPPMCVTGFPTADFVDGDLVKIVGLIEVAGTFEYKTVLGAKRKVYRVKLVTPEREKELQREKELAEKERKEAEREASFRTWTSADGKFTVEARFVEFKDGKVCLEKRDESLIEVSPVVLSRSDRDHYREIIKQLRSSNP